MRALAVAAVLLAGCGDDAPAPPRCDLLDDEAQPGLWWDERGEVDALVVAGEKIYAGGFVRHADIVGVAGAAVWDGSRWDSLGTLRGDAESVEAMAVDAGGAVWMARSYVGGASPTQLVEIERCDGACTTVYGPIGSYQVELTPVGGGVLIAFETPVARLVLHDGSTATEVPIAESARIAGVAGDGDGFCVVGTLDAEDLGVAGVDNAACWDGAWHPFGAGLAPATDLLRDGDAWYAVSGAVWQLDGERWREISAEVPGGCVEVAIAGGRVVCAGGALDTANGETVRGVSVRQDDGSWTLIAPIYGDSPDGAARRGLRTIAADGDRVVVGGAFCEIGGEVAVNLARVALDGTVTPVSGLRH